MTTPIPTGGEERRELPLSEEELAGLEHHNGGDVNIAALIAQAREALSLKAALAEVRAEVERLTTLNTLERKHAGIAIEARQRAEEEIRVRDAIEAERPKVQADASQLAMRLRKENTRVVALASAALVDLMPIERHEHEYQRRCPVCRYVWPANAGFRGQKHDLACPVGMAVDAVDEASDNVNRSPPNE